MITEKPLPCPLCGTESSVTRLAGYGSTPIWTVACGIRDDGTDACGLVLYGGRADSRMEMVRQWNGRQLLASISEYVTGHRESTG